MSCYFRHLGELFTEAGVEVTRQNRKMVHARIAEAVGLPEGHCPEIWQRIKGWKADPAKRTRLLAALRAVR